MNADDEHLEASIGEREARLGRQNEANTEALRRAEQKYRSIFEHAIEGIFQTTPTGTTSAPTPPLLGCTDTLQAELIAALTDIGHQLYVQPHRRAEFIVMMREHGKVAEFESQIYRRDRSIIWISENARAVHDEVSHELLYYEGLVQDITHHKRAEEARQPKRARMLNTP